MKFIYPCHISMGGVRGGRGGSGTKITGVVARDLGCLCSSKRQSFTGNREMADQEGLELGEFIYGRHSMPEF